MKQLNSMQPLHSAPFFTVVKGNRYEWCLKNGVQYGKTEVLLDKSSRVDLLPNRITLLIVQLTAR